MHPNRFGRFRQFRHIGTTFLLAIALALACAAGAKARMPRV